MSLLSSAQDELYLVGYLTIAQAASYKRVKYDAMRVWLRYHPEVPTRRIGGQVLVSISVLKRYRPKPKRGVVRLGGK